MTLYKVTDEEGRSFHGGSGKWTLGKWRSVTGTLVPCESGLHLCREQDLIEWLGPVIWEAETQGEVIEAPDKVVARKARIVRRVETWNDRTARLFAADCAERVLPLFEKAYPQDARPRQAIEVARRFARGEATDAAGDAAWDAAWDAARDAERTWQRARLMDYLEGRAS